MTTLLKVNITQLQENHKISKIFHFVEFSISTPKSDKVESSPEFVSLQSLKKLILSLYLHLFFIKLKFPLLSVIVLKTMLF
jgi:hypothetical protein